jgi:hypothetical protein
MDRRIWFLIVIGGKPMFPLGFETKKLEESDPRIRSTYDGMAQRMTCVLDRMIGFGASVAEAVAGKCTSRMLCFS